MIRFLLARRPAAVVASGAALLAPAEPSLCLWGSSKKEEPPPPPPPPSPPPTSSFGDLMPSTLPLGPLGEMTGVQAQVAGVSGITGYTAGFALKRTFKVFVFTTGCIFMGLQTLAQNDLITVHWDQMEKKLLLMGDLNGDGVTDSKDLQVGSDQLQAYLSAGLPSAGSFSAGLLLGLRS